MRQSGRQAFLNIAIFGVLPLLISNRAISQNTFPATGNVGVGTTAPQGPLQVVGTGPNVITLGESDSSSGKQIVIGVQTSGNGYGTIQSLYQGHAYIPLTLNQNGGNVGIGTTTPAYNLDIFTPALTTDTYSGLQIRSNSYGYLLEGGLKQGAGAVLKFSSNNNGTVNERMRIDPGGNVGIGTTNPQYSLSVNGTIQAKEVLVNTGWADYVFQPDYRVKSLAEVSAFIKANHHLPDIPSETEVKDKGVSLGDMQTKLLAKIEELTLQMIQLDEKNRKLDEKNRKLAKKVAQLEKR